MPSFRARAREEGWDSEGAGPAGEWRLRGACERRQPNRGWLGVSQRSVGQIGRDGPSACLKAGSPTALASALR